MALANFTPSPVAMTREMVLEGIAKEKRIKEQADAQVQAQALQDIMKTAAAASLSGASTPVSGAKSPPSSPTPSPTPAIRDKLTAVSAQASRIIEKLKEASAKLEELTKQNDDAKDANIKLLKRTEELESSSALLTGQLQQTQSELEKAKSNITASTEATLVIEAETGDLKSKILQYENELSVILKQTTELNELVNNATVEDLLKGGGRRQSSKRRQNNKNHQSKRRQLYKKSFHQKRKSTKTYK